MKHPKYKDMWTKSFGTEIRRLATTLETIFFIKKIKIPLEHWGANTYAQIVCVYHNGKKDKYCTHMVAILLTTPETTKPLLQILSQ
jgi:hypothetical protein